MEVLVKAPNEVDRKVEQRIIEMKKLKI